MKSKSCKICFIFLLGILALPLFPTKALAFCPLCVVTTGALTGLARWLGVDDTIIGLWLGGFITSLGIFLNNYLVKKQRKIKFQLSLILLCLYTLVIAGLYLTGDLTVQNQIFGLNKIIFGLIVGNSLLFSAPYLDKFLRKQNQGKIFISHQKVIIVVGFLLIFSLIFYLITK